MVHISASSPFKVTEETEALRFNTGISAMMEFVNGVFKWGGPPPRAALEPFVLLLAPYAPHLAEEMWEASSGLGSVPHRLCSSGVCLHAPRTSAEHPAVGLAQEHGRL